LTPEGGKRRGQRQDETDLSSRGRSESNDWDLREFYLEQGELSIVLPEVMAPGGDAVRLIDNEPSQHLVLK
jgi:hypothetical protein